MFDNNGDEEQTHDNASRLRNVAILFVVAMWARVDRVAPGQEVLILSIIDKDTRNCQGQ